MGQFFFNFSVLRSYRFPYLLPLIPDFITLLQIDPSKDVAVFARLSYDAYGERLSIVEELDVKKEKKFYEYILLYREVRGLMMVPSSLSYRAQNQLNSLSSHVEC